ncbi:AAA domain-containing protein [Nonomuraea endophytica]|uniref:AAA domain-containing protein n=1 Tax=Nonomuraea endophytica TaxID=714136 RepID=UPI0037CB9C11
MGWREEIVTALDEWIAAEGGAGGKPRWRRLGRAIRTGNGLYVVDVRGAELSPDRLDGLRLAGSQQGSVDEGFAVMDVSQSESTLTVRVAEFADPAEPHLWSLQQPPTFLVEALKTGLASLGSAPLGDLLACKEPKGELSRARPPAGLFPKQEEAYQACLGTGVWLVWGPPGTGKTLVLTKAIGDLIAAGKRILLVSATNIAVDNALLGILRDHRHPPGAIVRVGPPQLREVAENTDVSLPLLVRARLTATDSKRRDLSKRLVSLKERLQRLGELDVALVRFDVAGYRRDEIFLRAPLHQPQRCEAAVTLHRTRIDSLVTALATAERELNEAGTAQAAMEHDRRLWAQVDELGAEAARVDQAATEAEAAALKAVQETAQAQRQVNELEERGRFARLRAKRPLDAARQARDAAVERELDLAERAASGRRVADRRRADLAQQARALADDASHSRTSIRAVTSRLATASGEMRRLADERRTEAEALLRAEELAERVRQAQDRVAAANRHKHPQLQAEAERLRPTAGRDAADAKTLEKRYREVQEEYERLERDAQGEIIDGAKLVATTLARFRTSRRVFAGSYDVILVDEVGAATLPEVLLAVARAQTTAVLFGDFMQLGAVIPPPLRESKRADVQRWLLPDVFEHCGIVDPATAHNHPRCISLVTQNRFGPVVMNLANALAYDGSLLAGPLVHTRGSDDPEIVLIDTDGLHELAQPHLTGRSRGWWPAGVLLSRALAELHAADGEDTGIVTPYRDQAEATLEALRDIEAEGAPLADVGTAHRFQGREFPVVVFDTVEGQFGKPLWMGQASRVPNATHWQRTGLRLCNVAVTRVRTRLYIIASGERVSTVLPGTALSHIHALLQARQVRRVRATALITPPTTTVAESYLGVFGNQLKDVLARHVEISDVHDERDFYTAFDAAVRSARHSLWLWTPWVAKRVLKLLPSLAEAAKRGVRITVFVRDPSDQVQQENLELIDQVRAVAHTVVSVNYMHQKIAVIDERIVMLGSQNILSQSRTREVMLTVHGAHFARKLLQHEHANDFASTPPCGRCGGSEIDLRRRTNGEWYWRCYNQTCQGGSGRNAWREPVTFGTRRRPSGRPRP